MTGAGRVPAVGEGRDLVADVLAACRPDVARTLRELHTPDAGGRCAACAELHPCVIADVAERAARRGRGAVVDGGRSPGPADGAAGAGSGAADLLDELAADIEAGHGLYVATRLRALARSARATTP